MQSSQRNVVRARLPVRPEKSVSGRTVSHPRQNLKPSGTPGHPDDSALRGPARTVGLCLTLATMSLQAVLHGGIPREGSFRLGRRAPATPLGSGRNSWGGLESPRAVRARPLVVALTAPVLEAVR